MNKQEQLEIIEQAKLSEDNWLRRTARSIEKDIDKYNIQSVIDSMKEKLILVTKK